MRGARKSLANAVTAGAACCPDAAGAPATAARGHFVHVYVDRATRRPVALPAPLRDALSKLQ